MKRKYGTVVDFDRKWKSVFEETALLRKNETVIYSGRGRKTVFKVTPRF